MAERSPEIEETPPSPEGETPPHRPRRWLWIAGSAAVLTLGVAGSYLYVSPHTPRLERVTLQPDASAPWPGALTCKASFAEDSQGVGMTLRYAWFERGQRHPEAHGPTRGPLQLRPCERWRCEVTAVDARGNPGAPERSGEVDIDARACAQAVELLGRDDGVTALRYLGPRATKLPKREIHLLARLRSALPAFPQRWALVEGAPQLSEVLEVLDRQSVQLTPQRASEALASSWPQLALLGAPARLQELPLSERDREALLEWLSAQPVETAVAFLRQRKAAQTLAAMVTLYDPWSPAGRDGLPRALSQPPDAPLARLTRALDLSLLGPGALRVLAEGGLRLSRAQAQCLRPGQDAPTWVHRVRERLPFDHGGVLGALRATEADRCTLAFGDVIDRRLMRPLRTLSTIAEAARAPPGGVLGMAAHQEATAYWEAWSLLRVASLSDTAAGLLVTWPDLAQRFVRLAEVQADHDPEGAPGETSPYRAFAFLGAADQALEASLRRDQDTPGSQLPREDVLRKGLRLAPMAGLELILADTTEGHPLWTAVTDRFASLDSCNQRGEDFAKLLVLAARFLAEGGEAPSQGAGEVDARGFVRAVLAGKGCETLDAFTLRDDGTLGTSWTHAAKSLSGCYVAFNKVHSGGSLDAWDYVWCGMDALVLIPPLATAAKSLGGGKVGSKVAKWAETARGAVQATKAVRWATKTLNGLDRRLGQWALSRWGMDLVAKLSPAWQKLERAAKVLARPKVSMPLCGIFSASVAAHAAATGAGGTFDRAAAAAASGGVALWGCVRAFRRVKAVAKPSWKTRLYRFVAKVRHRVRPGAEPWLKRLVGGLWDIAGTKELGSWWQVLKPILQWGGRVARRKAEQAVGRALTPLRWAPRWVLGAAPFLTAERTVRALPNAP